MTGSVAIDVTRDAGAHAAPPPAPRQLESSLSGRPARGAQMANSRRGVAQNHRNGILAQLDPPSAFASLPCHEISSIVLSASTLRGARRAPRKFFPVDVTEAKECRARTGRAGADAERILLSRRAARERPLMAPLIRSSETLTAAYKASITGRFHAAVTLIRACGRSWSSLARLTSGPCIAS